MKAKKLSQELFKLGFSFPFKIYLKISDTKMVTLFNEGNVFDQNDLDKVASCYEKGSSVLAELTAFNKFLTAQIPNDGKISVDVATSLAQGAIEREEEMSDSAYLDQVVSNTTSFIKDILGKQKGRHGNDLLAMLQSMEKSDHEYMNHANQLFALSVTFLFLLPMSGDVEQIYELGEASILHGFSLAYISDPTDKTFRSMFPVDTATLRPKSKQESRGRVMTEHLHHFHFNEKDDFSVYLESLEMMGQAIESIPKLISRGTPRLIQDFKLFQIPKRMGVSNAGKPYFFANILLVADHILTVLGERVELTPGAETDNLFYVAIEELKTLQSENKTFPRYDQGILGSLLEQL